MRPSKKNALTKHLTNIASKGGKKVLKRYGREHFVALAKKSAAARKRKKKLST